MPIDALVVIGIVAVAAAAVTRRVWRAIRPAPRNASGCGHQASGGCGCGH